MSGWDRAWDRDRAVDRLGRLVAAETPSGDAPRLREAYLLLEEWGTEALGRSPEEVVVGGVPHLLWRAEGPPAVLLIGHADTVFAAGEIQQRPFRVEDGRATGPGAFDMKAGLVTAFDALGRVPDTSRVAVLVTGDEETGSTTSRTLIEDVARDAAAVLVLEPSLDGALKVGRKGGGIYELSFRGLAAHAGLEPERGRNALLAMASWAVRLPELADPDAGTTVTPTRATSGTAVNVVPDAARLSVDVRGATAAELDRVDRTIRRWSEGHDGAPPGHDVLVDVGGGVNRPPLEEAGSAGLVARCRKVAVDLGLAEPGTATVGGGSDGNFTAALGVPTLDGLGPTGDGAHTPYEWVEVDAIGRQAALVAGLVLQIINDND